MSTPTLLIDGDQYVYKATIACERTVRWDAENHVLGSNEVEALDLAVGLLEKTFRDLGSTKCRIAFTGSGENFRKGVLASYKGNRQTTRKPLCYPEVKAGIEARYPCLSVPGLEADDLMGIWQTRDDSDTIIVSEDKDMKTIPGKLYRQGELQEITPAEADYNFLHQTLTGDATDGYSGCPGVGAAGATKVLSKADFTWGLKTAWETIILPAYAKVGLTEEDALIQARLARILRSSEWDSVSKKVILWEP
jgi:DNA polymerase-1